MSVPKNETDAEKFRRIAVPRVERHDRCLSMFPPLLNYNPSDRDIQKLVDHIRERTEEVIQQLLSHRRSNFKF